MGSYDPYDRKTEIRKSAKARKKLADEIAAIVGPDEADREIDERKERKAETGDYFK